MVSLLSLVLMVAARGDIFSRDGHQAPNQLSNSQSAKPETPQQMRPLRPQEGYDPITLAGGETHYFQLALEANHYVHIIVHQRGINVAMALFGPDGRQVAEQALPESTHSEKTLLLITEAAGSYRLEVRARDSQAAAGNYGIYLRRLLPVTEQNQKLITADRNMAEGWRLHEIGTADALRSAIEKFTEAAPLWRATGDHDEETVTLIYLGECYALLSEYQKALATFEQALLVCRATGNCAHEGWGLNNIASSYSALGEKEKALGHYHQSLRAYQLTNDPLGAIPLTGMSQVQASLGDKQAALDSLYQALILWQGSGDTREARTLQRFGELYASVGESQLAFDHFDRALEVFRKTSDPFLEGQALHSLGRLHALLGQHQQALERLNQALGLRRQIGDLRGQAYTLTYLGTVYSSMGEKQQAENAYRQALPIWQTVGDRYGEAYTLTYLGALYDSLGERSKALELLEQALPLRHAARDLEGAANTLYHLAIIKRDQGNLDEARERIEAALNLIERVRTSLASQPLRASYFATVQDYYQFYLDLLMRLHARRPASGFDAVALQVSERARARTLNEMLVKARLATRSGVDPQLVERERSFQQRLDAKAKEHEILLRLGRQRAVLHKEIGSLIAELQEVEAQIRAASPYFAPPEQPAPLRLAELQQLLDSNTLLLEYALGAERSYLWAVTPTALASYELPKRARVEAAARHFYELLTARNKSVQGETSAQKRQRIIQADKQASTAAAVLSRMLLTPVAAQLGRKRLLIVADGALQYVPFAVLPAPATGPVGTGRRGDRETGRRGEASPLAQSPHHPVAPSHPRSSS